MLVFVQKITFIIRKIHQNCVCRLRLRPRPHWGNLQRSPRPPSCIQEACILLRGRGGGKEGREERKCEERGGEERGEREFVICPRKKKKSRRIELEME